MQLAFLYRFYLIGFLVLVLRLFWMQLIQADYYQTQSTKNRIRLIELPAPRGTLYDRHGEVLAEDRVTYDLVLIPQEVQDREVLFTTISKKLNIPIGTLRQSYQKSYRAPFAPVSLVTNISKEQALSFEENLFQLPGLFVEIRPIRHYPKGNSVAHAIGYLGEIDPEQLGRLKSYGYKMRDLVGQSGIEKSFDLHLRGEDGGTQIEVDHRGRMIRVLGHRSPTPGKDLQLTLDLSLQERATQLLAGRRGAIVVMDPWKGEILAMVSSPGFDPNAFLDSKRKREVKEWLKQKESPFFNRAVGAYTPGSIFKVITASAALRKGKIHSNTSFVCQGGIQLGNRFFGCWSEEGHNLQNLEQALTHSCNVYFYQVGLLSGLESLREEAYHWGLGKETGIPIVGEAPGLVPSRRWKWQLFQQPWYEGDTVNLAIGQGYLLATPLQAVRMIAVMANGGKLVKPILVKRIGEVELASVKNWSVVILEKNFQLILEGLRSAIASPTGTGQLAFSSQVSIAGKTGTAETPSETPHAWFIGFAPVENPKISISVFLEHGGPGGYAAAPIAKELVEGYFRK